MHNDPAVIWGTRRITWGQVEQYCATVINHLKGLGIRSGDRVAICAPTCTEYIIILFGLWRMKAVACPISPRWPSRMIADHLARVNASLLLTTVPIRSAFQGISVRMLNLNEVVGFDARKDFYEPHEPWQPDLEQEATVIATSGSSGTPKAAVHSWGNHHYSALGSNEAIPLGKGDRWLLSLPLYHVAGIGILARCFLAGAAMIIMEEDDLEGTIIRRRPTHVSLVPTQIHRLLQSPEAIEALGSLKSILIGGSAIPSALMERAISLGLSVHTSYGLTEMSSQVATGQAGGCVKTLSYRQCRISTEGEVLVRGETLFKGYIQAGRLHLPLDPEGWFKTGDLGRLDGACLTISGRRDNMFISGGENIQPEEIEKVLLSLEEVAQAVVIPKQDVEFGQRPVAFLKFQGRSIGKEELIKHCAQHLPRFKVPVAFYPWPEDLIEKGIKISRKDLMGRA